MGIVVGEKRRFVTDSVKGKMSMGRDVMLHSLQGGMGSFGREVMLQTMQVGNRLFGVDLMLVSARGKVVGGD